MASARRPLGLSTPIAGLLLLALSSCTAEVGRGAGGPTPGLSSGGSGNAASGGSGNGQNNGGSSGSAGSSTGGGGSSSGGSGNGGGSGGSGGTGNVGGVPPTPDDCDPAALTSSTPLRRLAREEYIATLRDLLAPAGLDGELDSISSAVDQLPADGENEHLFSAMDRRLSQRHVDAFYGIADALGKRITGDAASLEALAGECAGDDEPTEACVTDFVQSFGARVFRRPLTAAEVDRYLELRTAGAASSEVFFGVLFTFLLSPQLLYHLEIEGDLVSGQDRVYALTGFEKASRLSYLFWRTMPDDDLTARAAAGELDDDQGYQEAVERVFSDPRTRTTLRQFWGEWLGISGFAGFVDSPAFRAFAEDVNVDDALFDAMADEAYSLVDHFTWDDQGSYRDVLTSRLFFGQSSDLAELYGVSPWSGSGDPPSLAAEERSGLLTRAALVVEGNEVTNPIKRGAFILKQILCEEIDPPSDLPADALTLPEIDPTQSTRSRFEAKTSPPECAGCHSMINPLGFSLEVYDALGRYRTMERVFADDGELLSTVDINPEVEVAIGDVVTPVGSPVEFSEAIAASQAAHECLAKQYFRFALRRDEATSDACPVGAIRDQALNDGSLYSTFRSVALIRSFRERVMEAP